MTQPEIDTDTDDSWQYFMRGIFHRDQGDPDTAETNLQAAVRLGRLQLAADPTDPETGLELVIYLAALDRWEAARDEFDGAIRAGATPPLIVDTLEDLQDHLVNLPGVDQGRLRELMRLLENHRQSVED
ncbi:hypothetical protein ACFQ3B_23735 [Stackebrandtia endophytica]|uniref:hypothetical protein n=1 Tax=Stackebrandtia endophytica TaxID=1496996 RepID=UPI001151382F|nr:hypothetical protein [Stackebrandtia endophytica]